MDRIQFEDGRKISNAKVTIQEQDYEVIPALYEGSTPLSASVLNQLQENIEHAITEAILEDNKKKYYVGKIILDTKNINPSTYLGFGTWELWGKGKVPVGVDISDTDFNTVEKTGGEKTHQLTEDEMPKHGSAPQGYIENSGNQPTTAGKVPIITFKQDTWTYRTENNKTFNGVMVQMGAGERKGSDMPHNNLQPYITCYMWKRTA